MIGMGNPARKPYRLSISVLLIRSHATGLAKNRSKFSNPTQGLPQIPATTLYSLNAITLFAIGTYSKMTRYATGRMSST
jgi:hypothetical protein